ncbi:MAG: hypothetical protein KDK36_08535 [Leptospiraceae bacterium]|nr:hypothetical protein [Leptospiraceae bacterium]
MDLIFNDDWIENNSWIFKDTVYQLSFSYKDKDFTIYANYKDEILNISVWENNNSPYKPLLIKDSSISPENFLQFSKAYIHKNIEENENFLEQWRLKTAII